MVSAKTLKTDFLKRMNIVFIAFFKLKGTGKAWSIGNGSRIHVFKPRSAGGGGRGDFTGEM